MIRRRQPPQPELTAAWKVAYERGVAGALCDELVRRVDALLGGRSKKRTAAA